MKRTVLLFMCAMNTMALFAQSLSAKIPKIESCPMAELIRTDLSFAAIQYKVLMRNTPSGLLPRTYDAGRDKVQSADSRWWCSGFYPGTLWYIFEYTGDTLIRGEATRRMELLKGEQFNTHDHDLGFKMYCSFGNAYRITKNPAYKDAIFTAARSLSARYRPSIHSIQSWDSSANFKCPVIIDNMMNLELLEWVSQHGGDKELGMIAVDHANTTLKNHVRPDFSTCHVVDYDLRTGQVLRKVTWQGAADSSAWSRGQAWALYGYTMMYRFTRDTAYLSLAEHIAQFILNHPHWPADGVPYWDFDAPGIPNAQRDASAASVIASALLELARYSGEHEKEQYVRTSEKILRTLSSDVYLARPGTNGGFLLKHSVGALPLKVEVDVPLSYADYYFVEALIRYRNWYL
jgi:unsaturated chondroitin disaccharide hydrolase